MSKHSSTGTRWASIRARILDRDGHVCGYCGREATTVDHITAKANGGTDDDWNLLACCKSCNSTKGARTMVRVAYVNKRWLDRV